VVDIIESDDPREVERAALIIRGYGHATTETLPATPWKAAEAVVAQAENRIVCGTHDAPHIQCRCVLNRKKHLTLWMEPQNTLRLRTSNHIRSAERTELGPSTPR